MIKVDYDDYYVLVMRKVHFCNFCNFLKFTFVTIPKAPNTTLCNEDRTISLISHASKILLQIMKGRITPLAVRILGENQLAFRKGKGTRDGICQLFILSERMIEKRRKCLSASLTTQSLRSSQTQ